MTDRRLVRVWWVDSSSIRGWDALDLKLDLSVMSAGFLIHEDKERVVLTTSLARSGSSNVFNSLHSQLHIPRCAISKIAYIGKDSA